MKKIFLLTLALTSILINFAGCETPQNTLDQAGQNLQRGISGQGHLEERGWDDVEVYQK